MSTPEHLNLGATEKPPITSGLSTTPRNSGSDFPKASLRLGLIREGKWAEGIVDLKRAALDDGTFYYSFFKATARVG